MENKQKSLTEALSEPLQQCSVIGSKNFKSDGKLETNVTREI